MKKFWPISAALGLSLAVSACAIYPSVGSEQSATPPRIVVKDGAKVWDNPGLFGPVPADVAAKGAQVCGANNEARGYHAKALDANGNPFTGGGFYCVPKR